MKNRLALLILLFINTGLLSAQGTFSRSRNDEGRRIIENFKKGLIGKSLVDFRFEDMLGNTLQKKELTGKVIVINFWYTSCSPCISEMPLLNELVAAHKDTNVVFIAPALDDKERITKFLQKHSFNYQIVPEQEKFADKLKVEYFPAHIVADKKGIIRQVEVGYNARIKELLGKTIDDLLK